MKLKNYLVLFLILALALFLRLYHLGSNPPHLTPDEASLGFNAYSILKTGRDEYGKFAPLIFKSFGDFKPGLYVYTAIPSIAVFGLSEFSVRLPSVIAGVVAVILIYLICKNLFDNKFALIASFFLSVCPWHIYFSRGAWEINLSLTLTLAGIYFFLKSFKNQKLLILSAVFFASTLLTYQGAKISTFAVLLALLVSYHKEVFKFNKKIVVISTILAITISIPIVTSLFNGELGRASVFSVFSYPRPPDYLLGQLSQGNEKAGSISYFIFHSEALNFARGILGRYFNHFSGQFLFFEGDFQNSRHSVPGMGVLLQFDLILILLGLIFFIRSKKKTQKIFFLLWLALAPIASSITKDSVHAVRSYNMLIPLVILETAGSLLIFKNYKKIKLFIPILIFLYLANYIYFLDAYFIHLPAHNAEYWEYGYKQIVETVMPIKSNYKKVLIPQSYAQPYIYFLFFTKYDPKTYQQNSMLKESISGDVGIVEKLDNINFVNFDWPKSQKETNTLFVATNEQINLDEIQKGKFNIIKEIYYPKSKNLAFRIFESK
ncbi:MAG: glycosyltransferase family 39 protein [Candidatus Woesebacteria bacterium]|nr:MAG: glycosyltransferase family 39 protein [Candidatus Woesebacteria bacterium]